MAVISHPRVAYNGHHIFKMFYYYFYFLNYLHKKTILIPVKKSIFYVKNYFNSRKKTILIRIKNYFNSRKKVFFFRK